MREEKLKKCIKEIKKEGNIRDIEIIKDYLKTLEPFVNLVQEQGEKFEEIMNKSSLIMKHILKFKDEFVVQFGEKSDYFYIILNGLVGVFVPMLKEYYMTEEEFMLYLLNLRKNGQKELINYCLRQNAFSFSLPYEQFDELLNDLNKKRTKGGVFIDSELVLIKAKEVMKFIKSEEYKQNSIKILPEKYTSENDVSLDIKDMNEKINNDLKENVDNNDILKLKKITGNRKKMKIYKYEMVRHLTMGDTFGELALESKNNKRTATIIACEKSDFAIINKEEYYFLIKDSVKKYKKKFFNLIYSYKIFKNINCKLFDREHYNNFRFCRYQKNKILLQDNGNCNEIYFILDGEFEIYIEKNIYEINIIINKLKTLINKIEFLSEIKSKNQKIENLFNILNTLENNINKEHINHDTYKEILSKKKKIKLGIYTSRQVIGFVNYINDLFNNNNKSLVNCKCISYYGKFYRILYSKYNLLYQNEKNVKFFTNELVVLNVCHIIERLLSHKTFELDKIRKEKKDFEKKLNKRKLMKSYNKNVVNLENKKIKTNSFIKMASPLKFNINDNSNINIKQNNYSEIRKNAKNKLLQKNKIFLKFKNNEIQNNKTKKLFNKEKFKDIFNFSEIRDYSKINMKPKKKRKCPNSALVRKKIKNSNSSCNSSGRSKNINKSIKKCFRKPLSCSKSIKIIEIPNIYQVFFPQFSEISIDRSKENINQNNKFNKQLLSVYKLHEENEKNESITNTIKKNNFYKNNKLMFKKRINAFKKNNCILMKNNSQKTFLKMYNNNYLYLNKNTKKNKEITLSLLSIIDNNKDNTIYQ